LFVSLKVSQQKKCKEDELPTAIRPAWSIGETAKIVRIHDVDFASLSSCNDDSTDPIARENRIKESSTGRSKVSVTSVQTLVLIWLEVVSLSENAARRDIEVDCHLLKCAYILFTGCGCSTTIITSSTSVAKES
jgi:hypothetical protein